MIDTRLKRGERGGIKGANYIDNSSSKLNKKTRCHRETLRETFRFNIVRLRGASKIAINVSYAPIYFQYIIRQKGETKTSANIADYFLQAIDLARMPNDHIFRETKAVLSVLAVVLFSSRYNDAIFILSRSDGVWGKRHLRSSRVTGQKKSMANSEEIKWWAITSARLLPRTVQGRLPGLSQGMNASYLVFPAQLSSDPSTLIDKPDG